jgi:hypothetical protein
MSSNASIDFLEMLKGSSLKQKNKSTEVKIEKKEENKKEKTIEKKAENKAEKIIENKVEKAAPKVTASTIAVIDTETNWHDEVMTLGVAIADAASFKCLDTFYYIIDPEYRIGGMYSNVLRQSFSKQMVGSRRDTLQNLRSFLKQNNINRIFAYNAKFDCGHLKELADFEWYDIMRLAAYKQYNRAITDEMLCCKTGRLKTSYGVEPITRMLSGDSRYCEVHNAVHDAVDELRIMELLGQSIDKYNVAKIN